MNEMEKNVKRNIKEISEKLLNLADKKLRNRNKRMKKSISIEEYKIKYRSLNKEIEWFRIIWFCANEWLKIPRYWQKRCCLNCFFLNPVNMHNPCQYWNGWLLDKKCGAYSINKPKWLE